MPSEIRLTPTSYIVLGLIEASGESTSYDLKRAMAAGLEHIWSLNHAQLYSEPQRLAAAGYLSERRETGGRRRKHYKVTATGREALREWLAEPTAELTKGRVPSLLKLMLGADPKQLGEAQLPARRKRLIEYEELRASLDSGTPWLIRQLVGVGIEQQRETVRYWTRLAGAERS